MMVVSSPHGEGTDRRPLCCDRDPDRTDPGRAKPAKRADKRADEARLDAIRTRVLLDRNERKIVTMWRQLEPMLEDFAYASNPVDRDVARRKIQSLQWEMEALDAAITAIHDVAEPDLRTAYLK
jgi:hypothetical protein